MQPPRGVRRGRQCNGQPLPLPTKLSDSTSCWHPQPLFDIVMEDVDTQPNAIDCGFYALAFGTTLCSGGDPVKIHYHHDQMRSYLLRCLEKGVAETFPARKRNARRPRSIQFMEVYCHCRMPEGGSKMVQCILCQDWFHDHCENIPKIVWRKCHPKWKCCNCSA